MSRENPHEYILDENTKKRLRFVFYEKLKLRNDFEDFYQDYVVHILEGKGQKQTLEQFGVDWFREKSHWSRTKRSAPKFNILQDHHFKNIQDSSHESFGYIELVRELSKKYKGRYRIVVMLHYIYRMNQKEIGFLFAVSESRVSQMLTQIRMGKKSRDFVADNYDSIAEMERDNLSILKKKGISK